MENQNHSQAADDRATTISVPRRIKARARAGAGAKFAFYIHLAAYLTVNALLLLINAFTTPLLWWSLWVVLGWGFGLLIHALVSFLLPDLFGIKYRMYRKELARQIGQ
jgi:hypothetical protein